MPAMPKEKTSPIPITECNFVEMKMKEQLVNSSSTTPVVGGTKMPENILTEYSNNTTKPMQQQIKFNSSSCNDICSVNNFNSIRRTSMESMTTTGTTTTMPSKTNELITSSNSTMASLSNGSTTTNLLNSKNNDMNNKILNNGTKNSIIMNSNGGLSENNYCNNYGKSKIINNAQQINISVSSIIATPITTSNGIITSTSTPSNTSIKSNQSVIKNNSNHVLSSSSSASSTSTSTSLTSASAPVKASSGIIAKKSAKDYVFGKIIGEGSFSTVCLARDIHTNREYASK